MQKEKMKNNQLIKCYHVSRIKNRESILKNGLIPQDSKVMKYTNRLFFSIDKNTLGFDYVDYENVDVWSFFLPKKQMIIDDKSWADCFYYTSEKIPADKIKLEETII